MTRLDECANCGHDHWNPYRAQYAVCHICDCLGQCAHGRCVEPARVRTGASRFFYAYCDQHTGESRS